MAKPAKSARKDRDALEHAPVRDLARSSASQHVVSGAGSSSDRRQQWDSPTLRRVRYGLRVCDGFALSGGPYHSFDRSSRNADA